MSNPNTSVGMPPALFNAIKNGKLDVVRILLRNNPNWITSKDQDGKTPIYHAAESDNVAIVQYLIECGADVNAKSDTERTPLHIAVCRRAEDIIKMLVEYGTDVNAKDSRGTTSLHWAMTRSITEGTAKDRIEIARFLISNGADVNARILGYLFTMADYDQDNNITPLHLMMTEFDDDEAQHIQFLQFLVSHGADVNARTKYGNTPLDYAIFENKIEFVQFLLSHGVDVNAKDDCGGTPLHCAAWSSNVEIVKLLISKGADVKAIMEDGDTPIHYAARNGKLDVVQFLISKGADVYVRNKAGGTLLHGTRCVGVAKYLVSKGIDINARTKDGSTPLHGWASEGNKTTFGADQAIQFLVSNGADVNAKDNEGRTPLHRAAVGWCPVDQNIVPFLVSNGADISAKDKEGKTPLDLAKERDKYPEIVKYLESIGAKLGEQIGDVDPDDDNDSGGSYRPVNLTSNKPVVSSPSPSTGFVGLALVTAILNGKLDEVRSLLKDNPNWVTAKDGKGLTPLHYAVAVDNLEIIKFLTNRFRANVEAKNNAGCTPLDVAKTRGNASVIEYLEGIFATDMLFDPISSERLDEVITLLKDNPKWVNAKDTNGATPLHYAVWNSKN